jgi:hypothetical protein
MEKKLVCIFVRNEFPHPQNARTFGATRTETVRLTP